jgi:hypothetical protein
MMSSPWAEWFDRPGAFGLDRRKAAISASDDGKTAQGRAAVLVLYGCAFISSTRLNGDKTRPIYFYFFIRQTLKDSFHFANNDNCMALACFRASLRTYSPSRL